MGQPTYKPIPTRRDQPKLFPSHETRSGRCGSVWGWSRHAAVPPLFCAVVRFSLSPAGAWASPPLGVRLSPWRPFPTTVYFEHVHDASGAVAHRVRGGYSLPPDVAAAIDFACPTTHLPATASPTVAASVPTPAALHAARRRTEAGEERPASLLVSHNTPKALRQLYSIGNAQVRHSRGPAPALPTLTRHTHPNPCPRSQGGAPGPTPPWAWPYTPLGPDPTPPLGLTLHPPWA
eukprot:scaffold16440_cov97-Isochrysis_galbana.AAC.2